MKIILTRKELDMAIIKSVKNQIPKSAKYIQIAIRTNTIENDTIAIIEIKE